MKEVNIDYNQFLALVDAKTLLLQYSDGGDRYHLFAVEGNVSWSTNILKTTREADDFEANRKATSNQPLEYRSTDGLPKIASAMFSDTKTFWVDGTSTQADITAGQTVYIKKHFDTNFTISGVDARWYSANWGDYLDFEVGFYLDEATESTFQPAVQFADHYMIYLDGERIFDVPTVKLIPSTVNVSGTNFNMYVRTTCVNTGLNASKVLVNLVGWK
ncbi:MAG: hypothetical protein ACREBJ_05670 [Nitrosotalea sp.]